MILFLFFRNVLWLSEVRNTTVSIYNGMRPIRWLHCLFFWQPLHVHGKCKIITPMIMTVLQYIYHALWSRQCINDFDQNPNQTVVNCGKFGIRGYFLTLNDTLTMWPNSHYSAEWWFYNGMVILLRRAINKMACLVAVAGFWVMTSWDFYFRFRWKMPTAIK